MATSGTFDFNLESVEVMTNSGVEIVENVTEGLSDQSSIIGLAIALTISLTLIFGTIFLVINFIPSLLTKLRKIQK